MALAKQDVETKKKTNTQTVTIGGRTVNVPATNTPTVSKPQNTATVGGRVINTPSVQPSTQRSAGKAPTINKTYTTADRKAVSDSGKHETISAPNPSNYTKQANDYLNQQSKPKNQQQEYEKLMSTPFGNPSKIEETRAEQQQIAQDFNQTQADKRAASVAKIQDSYNQGKLSEDTVNDINGRFGALIDENGNEADVIKYQNDVDLVNRTAQELQKKIDKLNNDYTNGKIDYDTYQVNYDAYRRQWDDNNAVAQRLGSYKALSGFDYYDWAKQTGKDVTDFESYVEHVDDTFAERLANEYVSSWADTLNILPETLSVLSEVMGLETENVDKFSGVMKETSAELRDYAFAGASPASEWSLQCIGSLMPMINSMMVGSFLPVDSEAFTNVALGLQSGTETTRQRLAEGVDPGIAVMNGILHGIVTGLVEAKNMGEISDLVTGGCLKYMVSLGLNQVAGPKAIGQYMMSIAINEGTEEVLETLIDWGVDNGQNLIVGAFNGDMVTPTELNPAEMANEFVMAAAGTVLLGAPSAVNIVVNSKQRYNAAMEARKHFESVLDSENAMPEEKELARKGIEVIDYSVRPFEENSTVANAVGLASDFVEPAPSYNELMNNLANAIQPDVTQQLETARATLENAQNIKDSLQESLLERGVRMPVNDFIDMTPEARNEYMSLATELNKANVGTIFGNMMSGQNGMTLSDGIAINTDQTRSIDIDALADLDRDSYRAAMKGEPNDIFKAAGANPSATAAAVHEVTHFAEQSGQWNKLRNLVEQAMGKERFELAKSRLEAIYKSRGVMDVNAEHEAVAFFIQKNLGNKAFIKELAKSDASAFRRLRRNAKAFFRGDAQLELENTFVDAVRDAKKEMTAKMETLLKAGRSGYVGENYISPAKAQMSIAQYDLTGRDILKSYLKESNLSKKSQKELLDRMEEAYTVMQEFEKTGKFPTFSKWQDTVYDIDKDGNFSVVISNGDYDLNIDFSTVCKKRKMMDKVLNELSRNGFLNEALSRVQLTQLRNIIEKHGMEVACGLCFVDAKRFNQGSWAGKFETKWNGLMDQLVALSGLDENEANTFGSKASGFETTPGLADIDFSDPRYREFVELSKGSKEESKMAKALINNPELRAYVSTNVMYGSEGFEQLKVNVPKLYDLVNASGGSSKPKLAHTEVLYTNEIINSKDFNPEDARRVGGVRVQSFSDFMTNMVFDYVQMFGDMEAKKLTGHSYTKVKEYALLFGKSGMKINLSIIPAGFDRNVYTAEEIKDIRKNDKKLWDSLRENAGLDADGNYIFDKESFDWDLALEIQNLDGYDKNVGTICVGVSDKHIFKMLDDSNVCMVIPYHRSGINPTVADMMGIGVFNDYTNKQNTRMKNAKGRWVKIGKGFDFDFYNGTTTLDGTHFKGMIENKYDAKKTADSYLAWCEKNGYKPKFDAFAEHENYYKLLIDFRAYDKNGNVAPQNPIKISGDGMNMKPTLIDTEANPKLAEIYGYDIGFNNVLQKGLEVYEENEKTQDNALPDITKEVVEELNLKKTQYSLGEEVERIKAKNKKSHSKRDALILRDAGEKLSESDFYKVYSAHILNLRGNDNLQEQIDNIKSDGFKGDAGFGINVMPSSINNGITGWTEESYNKYRNDLAKEYGFESEDGRTPWEKLVENPPRDGAFVNGSFYRPLNMAQWEYGVRKGQTVLLVPETFVENGSKVKNGFKPFDYEIVTADRDFQPYYELYEKAYDESKKNAQYSLGADYGMNNLRQYIDDHPDSKYAKLYNNLATRKQEAEKMRLEMKDGKRVYTDDEIYKKTGWMFDSTDSVFKGEFYDDGTVNKIYDWVNNQKGKSRNFDDDSTNTRLKDVVGDDSLFLIMYPKLADAYIFASATASKTEGFMLPSMPDEKGYMKGTAKRIRIGKYKSVLVPKKNGKYYNPKTGERFGWGKKALTESEIKDTIAHEIQHAIQLYEQFYYGDKEPYPDLPGEKESTRVGSMQADPSLRLVDEDGNIITDDGREDPSILLGTDEGNVQNDEPTGSVDSFGETEELGESDQGDGDVDVTETGGEEDTTEPIEPNDELTVPDDELNITNGNLNDLPSNKTAKVLEERPRGESLRDLLRQGGLQARRFLIDKYAAVDDLAKRYNNKKLTYLADRVMRTGAIASRAIYDGIVNKDGKVIGKSLTEIMGKISPQDKQLFGEYMYHWRNVDEMSMVKRFGKDYTDKPVFGNDVTADDSMERIREIEKTHPEFKEVAEEMWELYRNLLGIRRDAGIISQKTYDKFIKERPHYVRIIRNVNGGTGGTALNPNDIKRFKGSTEDIIPIDEATMAHIQSTYRVANNNELNSEILKTLGAVDESEVDDIESLVEDGYEPLAKGSKTLSAYRNGIKYSMDVSDELAKALTPTEKNVLMKIGDRTIAPISQFRKALITSINPIFTLFTNPTKDLQDAIRNTKYLKNYPRALVKAVNEIIHGGELSKLYDNVGVRASSYMGQDIEKAFKKINNGNAFAKAWNKARNLAENIEKAPRLAEFIASLEAGNSIDQAAYDAAEITTNFKRGGTAVKTADKYGFTFLSASVAGFDKQIRNAKDDVEKIRKNGIKGMISVLAQLTLASGLPLRMLLDYLWRDDDDYENLSDYVKNNYYIVGKTNGRFIRIPKGRVAAFYQTILDNIDKTVKKQVDVWDALLDDLVSFENNLAPNNFLDNNMFSPIVQAYRTPEGRTWYGEDLVPSRLQDVPDYEQYDEGTDSLSIAIGQLSKKVADALGNDKFQISPYKLNYLLDQYTGVIGDVALPALSLETSTSVDGVLKGPATAILDKFTTDPILKNQNVTSFYSLKEEMDKKAKGSQATDEEKLVSKYLGTVSSAMGKLYGEKRKIQLDPNLSNKEKLQRVREIQTQINDLARNALGSYDQIDMVGKYASVGDVQYYQNEDGSWTKPTSNALEKLNNADLSMEDRDAYFQTYGEIDKIRADIRSKTPKGEQAEYRDATIEAINNSKLSAKGKNAMYDSYYSSKFSDYVNEMNLTDEQKYNIKVAKTLANSEKDANGKTIANSKAWATADAYKELGVLEDVLKYIRDNDIKPSDMGLSKTVYESLLSGSSSSSSGGKTSSKSSKKSSKSKVGGSAGGITRAKGGGSTKRLSMAANPIRETKTTNSFVKAYADVLKRNSSKATSSGNGTIVCPKCGNRVSSGLSRCPICGASL